MVIIGADLHKRTHTGVAVDEAGRKLGHRTVAATPDGHLELLNVVLHRIAITQIRIGDPGRTYFDHRLAAGDTRTEAIRALRRRISDEVYRRMREDEAARATQRAALAAAA